MSFEEKMKEKVRNSIEEKREWRKDSAEKMMVYLRGQGWRPIDKEGAFWESNAGVGLNLSSAYVTAKNAEYDKSLQNGISNHTRDIRCNKCGNNVAESWDTSHAGYYGLVDARVDGGYFSKHLSDGVTYRFSLCEKCLVDLFKTFSILPDVNVYMD